jgi:hypothetical protein
MPAGIAACGSVFGPDLDGPQFIAVEVNGQPWEATDLTSPIPGLLELSFNASHAAHDSAGVHSQIFVFIGDFHGADDYPLGTDQNHELIISGNTVNRNDPEFQATPGDPGKLVVTSFRESDSTIAGIFVTRVHVVQFGNSSFPPGELTVTGSFRIRPAH